MFSCSLLESTPRQPTVRPSHHRHHHHTHRPQRPIHQITVAYTSSLYRLTRTITRSSFRFVGLLCFHFEFWYASRQFAATTKFCLLPTFRLHHPYFWTCRHFLLQTYILETYPPFVAFARPLLRLPIM